MIHITDTSPATIGKTYGILITVNTGFTGTLTVNDDSFAKAVITNPVVGNSFRYFGFTGSVSVTASATGDTTVSALNHQG